MRCQYLKNYSPEAGQWQVTSCTARESLYVPSVYELHGYCIGEGHRLCPFYLRKRFELQKKQEEAA
ncbi:hypothetical protein [Thermosulfuriphilus sp.]